MKNLTTTVALACMSLVATSASAQGVLKDWTPQRFAGRERVHVVDTQRIEPFKLVGNIYYVGAVNTASYLITTPEGHILVDTGNSRMQTFVLPNVEKLGFKPADIKILLLSHAHSDHVQSMEMTRKITGATVYALDKEMPSLTSGHDFSVQETEGFEPITVGKVLTNGDTVSLGGQTLKIISTPGHTPGTATYVTSVQDGGKTYQVVIGGPPTPVTGNPKYNTPVADATKAYADMRTLNPDIVLHGHPRADFEGKLDAMRAGVRPLPMQLAPGAWLSEVNDGEMAFKKKLTSP